ncbi:putative nuclease HARBI1 [Xyrichtys novacula]|uniref:Nuclease HARBI1 n=1 Tax=Xyrichtys novacula TaxID=13765 RepID=A0AAV1GV64_XYRNO|nr:putative nuclease HARBI1 [Xyrichtys novacula]
MYFDGESDLRPDFRLTRVSFRGLMAVLGTQMDHGWGPTIEALVFLFWLASGTSYHVVTRAFATEHRMVHKTCREVVALLPLVVLLPSAEDLPHLGAGFAIWVSSLQQGCWQH